MLQAFFVAHIGSSAAPLAKPVQRYLWRPLSGTELLDLPATDNILPFCFPAGVDGITPKEYAASEVRTCTNLGHSSTTIYLFHLQSYIFTLTAGDGSRLHGFCRRFLPPRTPTAALRLPVVACLITPTMWVDFMHKVRPNTYPVWQVAARPQHKLRVATGCWGAIVPLLFSNFLCATHIRCR